MLPNLMFPEAAVARSSLGPVKRLGKLAGDALNGYFLGDSPRAAMEYAGHHSDDIGDDPSAAMDFDRRSVEEPGNGYRFAEFMSASNPSGWSGVIKVKPPPAVPSATSCSTRTPEDPTWESAHTAATPAGYVVGVELRRAAPPSTFSDAMWGSPETGDWRHKRQNLLPHTGA